MALSGLDMVTTARITLTNPRQGARVVLGWPLSVGELWLVLTLMAVMSALLAEVFVALVPDGVDPAMAAVLASPVGFSILQFAGLVILACLLFGVGRLFGGTGRFSGALALVGWLQAILLVLQVAQIVALVLLPPLSLLIGLGSLVLTLWLMTSFTAELHGFKSLLMTFLGMLGSTFALIVAISLVLIFVFGVGR